MLGPAELPLPLGGAGSPVPVVGSGGPLAWLGLADGEVFVQPSPGASVVCNGTRLSASHWLRDGDALRLGPTRVEVSVRADGVRLVVLALAEESPTEPPVVLIPPPRGERLSPEDAQRVLAERFALARPPEIQLGPDWLPYVVPLKLPVLPWRIRVKVDWDAAEQMAMSK